MKHETNKTGTAADHGGRVFTVVVKLDGFQLRAVEGRCSALDKKPEGLISELVGAAVSHLTIAGAGQVLA